MANIVNIALKPDDCHAKSIRQMLTLIYEIFLTACEKFGGFLNDLGKREQKIMMTCSLSSPDNTNFGKYSTVSFQIKWPDKYATHIG